MKMKKIIFLLVAFMMLTTPVFAETLTIDGLTNTGTNPIKQIVVLCTGVIPGAIISIKFIFDIVSAMMHREQDPTKLQKAIINLVITVGVIVLYVVLLTYIFGKDNTSSGNAVTQQSFMQGLTGESLDESYLLDAGFELKDFDFHLTD